MEATGETRKFVRYSRVSCVVSCCAGCRYWAEKVADPTFHNGTQGGPRNCNFPEHEQHVVEAMLWAEVLRDPMKRLSDYAQILTDRLHVDIDAKSVCCLFFFATRQLIVGCLCRWVGRVFRRLNFSTKVAKYRNLNKFTAANALYTARYLLGIQRFAWTRLKFFDEVSCSFEPVLTPALLVAVRFTRVRSSRLGPARCACGARGELRQRAVLLRLLLD